MSSPRTTGDQDQDSVDLDLVDKKNSTPGPGNHQLVGIWEDGKKKKTILIHKSKMPSVKRRDDSRLLGDTYSTLPDNTCLRHFLTH